MNEWRDRAGGTACTMLSEGGAPARTCQACQHTHICGQTCPAHAKRKRVVAGLWISGGAGGAGGSRARVSSTLAQCGNPSNSLPVAAAATEANELSDLLMEAGCPGQEGPG